MSTRGKERSNICLNWAHVLYRWPLIILVKGYEISSSFETAKSMWNVFLILELDICMITFNWTKVKIQITSSSLRKKCPYSELFWPALGLNADQNNSEYGYILRSAYMLVQMIWQQMYQHWSKNEILNGKLHFLWTATKKIAELIVELASALKSNSCSISISMITVTSDQHQKKYRKLTYI